MLKSDSGHSACFTDLNKLNFTGDIMKQRLIAASALASLLVLGGCGSGGDDNPSRGSLLSSSAVAKLPVATIDASTQASGLNAVSGPAKCDVSITALDYQTAGAQPTESVNATGVLLLPSGPNCPGPYPLLAYARGTEVLKSRALANQNDPETASLAAIFAAQGYAVVATDYLGFAGSQYTYHPYLHADSEASAVIDSIRAARKAAADANVPLSGKVMVSGYSQGGHASMATQRAIERDNAAEINLVAAGHMSGPYNLSQSIISGATTPIGGGQFFVPFFITAWQKVYGNLYSRPTDVFKEPYASGIESLFPGQFTYTTMLTNGKVPADANYLPSLFQPSYLTDIATNPNNPTIVAAKRNDLLGWNPKARTVLCGGAQDPTVAFELHTRRAAADFATRGINVPVIDVDPTIRAVAAAAGRPVDLSTYHGQAVPPLCMVSLREQLFNPLK
jgi:pimeloyl-ACP methyl ester carboxylesterase